MIVEPLQLTHPTRHLDRDVRYTPAWCTEALLDACPPPRGRRILDPAAGDGAILRVCAARGWKTMAVEIRPECGLDLAAIGPTAIGDWLTTSSYTNLIRGEPMAAPFPIVCNPPYSIGAEFMTACLRTEPPYCAALLRLNHLGSATWVDFWRKYPLDRLLILGTRRPSFSADGKTDASEYAWVIWGDVEKGVEVI